MGDHKTTEIKYIEKTKSLLTEMPDYVHTFARSIHNNTSPYTAYQYLYDIKIFLQYLSQDETNISVSLATLQSLSKEDFENYFEHMEYYEKNGKLYTNSRTSLKRKIISLRVFFKYLFENDLISSEEIRKINIPKIYKKEILHLDKDETQNLLDTIENGSDMTKKEHEYHKKLVTRDMALVYLFLTTGMRVSECAELNVSDVDIKKCSLSITRKGGNESTVYFSDEALPYLKAYLQQRKDMDVQTDALFVSTQKTRLTPRSIQKLIKKYAAKAVPSKKITPHKLRATYATDLYETTGDIYLVAETLGHKDVTTTKDHYANLSNKIKQKHRNAVTFRKK